MLEEIQRNFDSFLSRLNAIKSRHSQKMNELKLSRTSKRLAKEGGGAIGELLTGSIMGKRLGKAVASDFFTNSQKQQREVIETECVRNVTSLITEITNFLSGVSIFYKTNPQTNSDEIIRRFRSVEGKQTCNGKINRTSEILASLRSKNLVYNADLEKKTQKPRERVDISKAEMHGFQITVAGLVERGENEKTEFKSTLRWDISDARINKELEYAVVRTIAGFMNSKGGVLLIGVEDNRRIRGIQDDLKTLRKKNCDGFEIHLRQLVEARLGKLREAQITVKFKEIQGKEVCIVYVYSSEDPVFLKSKGGKKEFPVRFGNSTKNLDVEETANYIGKRWLK